jgi:D-beta-D-heptose 7-phosphate kinase/D-beta-D-heptose 1-phosphate adenosyltransferase
MPKVIVIGDVILDVSYICSSKRLAQEACIPVLKIKRTNFSLGGSANVFQNLVSMGVETHFISVIGNDENGLTIERKINDICQNTLSTYHLIKDDKRITTTKHRYYVEKKIVFRCDDEDCSTISHTTEKNIFMDYCNIVEPNDIIILSDYNKGVLTRVLIQKIINMSLHNKICIDPKCSDLTKYKNCFLIKPNKDEGEQICGHKINYENMKTSASEICRIIGCENCLLTLGKRGLLLYQSKNDEMIYDEVQPTNIIDITGAGDIVMAGFVYAMTNTNDLYRSTNFANYCGQLKVKHFGTYTISPYDIAMYNMQIDKYYEISELEKIVKILKENGKTIVMTNGCFDILHYGHLKFLNNAKKLGMVLIVALNTDNSVKMNKGDNRPINCLDDRINQIAELSCVDLVTSFCEKTPYEIIKVVKPNILVKGGDYKIENIVGREFANETIVLNYEEGFSSTNIINKSV